MGVNPNEIEVKRLKQAYPRKSYITLHNHPKEKEKDNSVLTPSPSDINTFLNENVVKSLVIAQNTHMNPLIEGYLYLRKTKKTKQKYEGDVLKEVDNILKLHNFDFNAIESICNKYDLKYRFIPARGYKLSSEKPEFIKKEQVLESKVVGIIGIISFVLSLIFLSSNLTGLAINNFNLLKINYIGNILFLIGILMCIIYFRKNLR